MSHAFPPFLWLFTIKLWLSIPKYHLELSLQHTSLRFEAKTTPDRLFQGQRFGSSFIVRESSESVGKNLR